MEGYSYLYDTNTEFYPYRSVKKELNKSISQSVNIIFEQSEIKVERVVAKMLLNDIIF